VLEILGAVQDSVDVEMKTINIKNNMDSSLRVDFWEMATKQQKIKTKLCLSTWGKDEQGI
jgi:hypothetical protein